MYAVWCLLQGSASSVVSATDSFVRLSRVNPVADNVYTCGADASSRDDTDIVLIGQSNTRKATASSVHGLCPRTPSLYSVLVRLYTVTL